MNNTIVRPPKPVNEPVRDYAPGSPERASLQRALRDMRARQHSVMPIINGERIETGVLEDLFSPHDLQHQIGTLHKVGGEHVEQAIGAAIDARHDWMRMEWTDRAAIFLKAADLLAGPWRDRLNAATMLGQSKNAYQAEIDSACELIDFFPLQRRVHAADL